MANEDKLAELAQKLETIERLVDLSKASFDPAIFSSNLVRDITNVVGLSACSFLVPDEQGNLVRVAAIGPNIDRDYFLEIENELTKRAFKKGRVLVEEICPSKAPPKEKQTKFYIAEPIIYRDRICGVLFASSFHPLSKENERFLSVTAHQLGIVVDSSCLEERMKLEVAEFSALIEIGTTINSQLDIHTLLDLVTHTAAQLVRGETASLMLIDPETDKLKMEAACGLDEALIKHGGGRAGHKIAEWVVDKGAPLLLTDTSKDRRFRALARKRRRIKSALSVPLRAKEKIIGVLSVDNVEKNRPFSAEDLSLLTILARQAATAIENARLYTEMRELYLSTIRALVLATEIKTEYGKGHADRVTNYAVEIADELEQTDEFIENIRYAGILHDIGKIGVPEAILLKPAALNLEERQIIESHPKASAKIIQSIKFLSEVVPIVWHHHERYDGKGYTDELKGEEIPLGSRILAVADAYEAMTSERPYRPKMTEQEAQFELKKCAGSQFDPKLVKVFLSIVKKKESKKSKKRKKK